MPSVKLRKNLIKIGELASASESLSSIRHWIKAGLLDVADSTDSGYQLFDKSEIAKCKQIRHLQNQKLTLEEILH